jgi:hypothetical protein
LTDLLCSNNQLLNLPELPNTLNNLYCYNNKLSSLPKLPNTLINFNCSKNKLLSLPLIPSTLTYLDCSCNQLSSLPELPHTLTELICCKNKLLSLPKLPPNLLIILHSNNPFNLWTVLIDPTKINADYAEIIYEKLNILDHKIKEIEDDLNKNTFEEIEDEEMAFELTKNMVNQYNQKMSELKKEIDKIVNFELELEIIL